MEFYGSAAGTADVTIFQYVGIGVLLGAGVLLPWWFARSEQIGSLRDQEAEQPQHEYDC